MDLGIPQGLSISQLLLFVYIRSVYNDVKETDAHAAGLIDKIIVDKDSRDIDENRATLSKVLLICHEWAQECYIEFDYGNR